MKIVISTFGSSGDFNPCLGIARQLRKNNIDVIFMSNPFFENKIRQAGLRFYPAGQYFDVFREIENNPDYLHPSKGPRAVWQLVLKTAPVMYDAMTQLIKEEAPDLIACHILEYGSMLAAIENSIPYATLGTTPMAWTGPADPPYCGFTQLPLCLRSLQARCILIITNIAFNYTINSMCKKNGLPQEFNSFEDEYRKAIVNLGLWSETLKPSSPDDPPNSTICGFVRDEHIKDWPDVPPEINALFEADKKPVIAGLGSTASLHGYKIYDAVAQACQAIDQPCLLIGKGLDKLANSNKNIHTVDFAPFGWVFPRSSLVVHHGGLNTTAEALRAGVPAIVVPHAYDQYDNAIKTELMGTACKLRFKIITPNSVMKVIKKMLSDNMIQQKAKDLSQKLILEPDGAKVAAEILVSQI